MKTCKKCGGDVKIVTSSHGTYGICQECNEVYIGLNIEVDHSS